MSEMRAKEEILSPNLAKVWGFVRIHHLVLATPDFIVWIDHELDIDWKTSPDFDKAVSREFRQKHASILNRASVLESGDWDRSNPQRTLNFKRQIAEAMARSFDGDFDNAEKMLTSAESYREATLKAIRRKEAIAEQIAIKDRWRKCGNLWVSIHYIIGVAALLFSTLIAAKPALLNLNEGATTLFAWLVALMTGLLTFLAPDKKADRYTRAWSILNSQITRYNADESYTVNDVLDACQRGESIIFQDTAGQNRRGRSN